MAATLRDIHFAAEHGEPLHLTAEEVRDIEDEIEAALAPLEARWQEERLQ